MVKEHATSSDTELSRTASKAVTSMHKALQSFKERPRLNPDSETVEFFGLKSSEDMGVAKIEELFTD